MSDERLLALADLAEGQWGLLTSGQAAAELDITALTLKRYADRGLLFRLRHGVYRLAGSPGSPLEQLRAEWLALEPRRTAADRLSDPVPVGVVSHRSAAALQDLGDLDADVHQFTVPRRRHTRSPDVAFRVAELDPGDWHRVGGLPVTRPLRTVVDLAAARTDGGHLAGVVRDAILTGDTTPAQLADALRGYAHYYGLPPGDSAGLVRDFIEQAGIPSSALHLAAQAIIDSILSAGGFGATAPKVDLAGVFGETGLELIDRDNPAVGTAVRNALDHALPSPGIVPVSDIDVLVGPALIDSVRKAVSETVTSSPAWAEMLTSLREQLAAAVSAPGSTHTELTPESDRTSRETTPEE